MRVESLRVQNYRALRDVTILNIPAFAVFVGPNGSGKSTLFDVFGFLKDALDGNVRTAITKRGGYREVVSRGQEKSDIAVELQFRVEIVNVERLVTYRIEIGLDDSNRPIVKREWLRYKRGPYGRPFRFLDFERGTGRAVINEEDFSKTEEQLEREEQRLDAPDILAIKGLGQFQRFKAANALRQLIEGWYVANFQISHARGAKDSGYAEHLSATGDNLPLVAQYIYENHPQIFDQIREKMRERVPGVQNVEAEPTQDGRLVLRFHDGAFTDPFVDRFVSDGTVKMFAYLVLLHDPSPHPLVCIEEPENQLYPQLLNELAEEFRLYASAGGQAFVSTHSPEFLNAVRLEEIYWLQKSSGYTEIRRAADSELLQDLVAQGDLPGQLWLQRMFKGANLG